MAVTAKFMPNQYLNWRIIHMKKIYIITGEVVKYFLRFYWQKGRTIPGFYLTDA
jgi:hypothetical protein